MQFSELTRAEAQRRAEKLVKEGQLAQERAQAFVDDMVESSRRRADDLLGIVRGEFQRQVQALGIATKDDLARLEAKLSDKKKSNKKDKKGKKKNKKDDAALAVKKTKRPTAADGASPKPSRSPAKKRAGRATQPSATTKGSKASKRT